MQDRKNGPLNYDVVARLRNTHVEVKNERVNAFRLQSVVAEFDPDCVVSFGSWRNVLNDSVVGDKVQVRPSDEERRSIQGRQCKIYNIAPDFLVSFSSAVIAQTKASHLNVGPSHYLWRNLVRCARPQQQFWIDDSENADYYQGSGNMGNQGKLTNFVANYWPSCPEVMPKLNEAGRGSIVELLSRHERILVISAGRGDFWAEIIDKVDQHRPLACRTPLVPIWAENHHAWLRNNGWAYTFDTPCGSTNCGEADVCMRCLRRIKYWSWIEEMKYFVRGDDAGCQCDAEGSFDVCTGSPDVNDVTDMTTDSA